jgi:ferric-dicitrate binding protein FerR (iron transport regulator)
MNNYRNFSVEDFLQDEFFNEWVTKPDANNTAVWEKWLAEHPEMLEITEEAKNIIATFNYHNGLISEEFYRKVKDRIDSTITGEEGRRQTVRMRPMWMKAAAVFTGLMIAAAILFYSLPGKSFKTYSSTYRETKEIILPDGSEVVLNANSSLKYSGSNEKDREVWLNGEGFFKIKHIENPHKSPEKLIVHASDVDIEVTGTEFNINTRNKNKTEVLLTEGKVTLSAAAGNHGGINMHPGELAYYNNSAKSFSISKVSPENYIAWIDHKYVFEKTSLEDLCREIEQYYGKAVMIEDPKMRKQLLSGTLELKNEDILIQTLSALLGAQINKKSNRIIIYSKPNS